MKTLRTWLHHTPSRSAGAGAALIAERSVSEDLWRYPWTSEAFVPISLLWAIAHALVIVDFIGLRRSGVADPHKERRG